MTLYMSVWVVMRMIIGTTRIFFIYILCFRQSVVKKGNSSKYTETYYSKNTKNNICEFILFILFE